MPQETDAATGNFILEETVRSDPLLPVLYRTGVTAADGTTKPAPGSGLFAANPGYRQTCRVFVSTSGSPTTCTIRPYVRSGGSAGQVGTAALQTLNAAPNFDLSFDIVAAGDDIALLVETLSGGASPAVTIYLSWR